jgi:hypothetical protein
MGTDGNDGVPSDGPGPAAGGGGGGGGGGAPCVGGANGVAGDANVGAI